MRPDDPLRWILIRREMPIEDWAIDHLFLDQDAQPTLVEVKRGESRRIRRTVVGQMLDYAATAAGVWSGDGMRQAFEEDTRKRGKDPLDELNNLLRPDDETDTEDLTVEFWERAATNLAANRLRLLFVADEIPDELERVVKFLNEHTKDNLEVLAVEVKQYPGQFGDALVSRVIGQTDDLRQGGAGIRRRERITREEFLHRLDTTTRHTAERFIQTAESAGGHVASTSNGGIRIEVSCHAHGRPVRIARFNTPSDDKSAEFHFRTPDNCPDPLQTILSQWRAKFQAHTFAKPSPQRGGASGWMVSPEDATQHVELLTNLLREVITEIRSL